MKKPLYLITKQYLVTKQFTGGLLAGITVKEATSVKFPVGFVTKPPYFGSPYKVVDCKPITKGA